VLQHHSDGVQTGSPVTGVLAVVERDAGGIEWLDQAGERLPGRRCAARDAAGAVAPEIDRAESLQRFVLVARQRA
jgi:hypothetical protein